jgi:hypothetical protein
MAARIPPVAAAPAAPPPATPALVPPAVPHVFTRVTLPGLDNTLDFVAVSSDCLVVSGLPDLGWEDSSAVQANTRAVPLLTAAGTLCLPAFLAKLGDAPTVSIENLGECTVRPTLALLNRCADACASLDLLRQPKRSMREWCTHLSPALARLPTPSPFRLGAGELEEANAFRVAGVAAVRAVAAVPAIAARRGGRGRAAVRRVPGSVPFTGGNHRNCSRSGNRPLRRRTCPRRRLCRES